MTKVIFNADDLGLTLETNQAIAKAHRNGVLTSASLMVTMPAFSNALAVIKKNPKLGVGLHLSLTVGKSVLSQSYFKLKFWQIFILSLISKRLLSQIEAELRAQVDKALTAGIKPDHINGQHHIQMIPKVAKIFIKIAQEYQIPYLRTSVDFFLTPKGLLKNLLMSVLSKFNQFPQRVKTTAFFGLAYSAQIDSKILTRISQKLPLSHQPLEIAVHPSFRPIQKPQFDYQKQGFQNFIDAKSRQKELTALSDPKILAAFGPHLARFRDLASHHKVRKAKRQGH